MFLLAIGGAFWAGQRHGEDRAWRAQQSVFNDGRKIGVAEMNSICAETYAQEHKARDVQIDDCRAALSVMGAIHMSMQEYEWPNEKPTEVCRVRFNRADGTQVTYSMPPAWKKNARRFDPDAKCSW